MDVLMPDGTTITGVPEGITQSELLARYGKYTASGGLASLAKPAPTLSPEEQMMGAVGAPSEPQEQIPRLPGDQAEMRPYEPSFSEQLMGLLPGNRAKAANEYAARKIAEEKNISVGQVYKDIGGARPVFNPEGRAPIRAGVESGQIIAGELPKVPGAALSTFLKAYRAGDIESPTDASMVDKAISAMKPTDSKGKPDPNYEAFQGLGESLGFSLATMVTSATAAAAGELAGPATAVAAGMGASGAIAYRASKDDFLSRVRDKLNGESQKLYGTNISAEDWNKAKKEYNQAATEYGAWEAIPEAVSNAVFLKAFAAPVRASGRGVKEISGIMEKLGAQGVEQGTETITNLGQNAAELKAGLTDEEMNLADAFRQQFVQTLLIGGVMSGGMKAKEAGDKFYQNVVEPRVRPGSALAKAIQADVDAVAFNPESTRRAAVQALNPNRAQEQVVSEPGIASLLAKQQIAMPPPPEELEQPIQPKPIAPQSASQDTEAMLREILGPDTNTVSVEKPAEVPAFKAPAGFAYSVTQSPAYEGVEPLSADDAQFELDALLESAKRGRMTPERFAQSEIGQRLNTGQVMLINEGIKANPIATIEALMQKIAPAEQAPTAQTTEETKPEKKTEVEQTQLPGRMTVEVPVGQLQLSEDVPQFKTDANKQGIVEPLGGKFERTGVAPIQVWRREDGRMEVISGRHRFDLAKRSGEETIPAQIHDEKAGFTKDMAAVLDAELNIRDGQGKVKDYVNYFKGTGLDQETAESRGLLARSPGKRAFTIANQGSDELIAGVRSDKVGDEAAYLIALNAPNDPRLQGVGIKAIQEGKSASNAVNLMQAVKALASEADTTTDMFGFDDSAMKEAEDMAKIAASKQREVQTRLSAITGAAKNPAVAKAEGIDVRDPEAVKRRINELRQLKTSWDNWSTNPNLISEIRTARGAPAPELQLRGETEAEIRQREATQEGDKAAAEQKAIADREVDMFKLQPQVAEKGEAPTMDMFGAADMANQPAQTKQASELTEGLFAQKPQTEQERIVSMTKKEFREDKETRGKTDHPALKMVFKDQTPKGLIEKYGEKDVRFLGRLFDIDVKDKFNVAKKLIAINSGLDLVRGKDKAYFDKMNKAQLGEFLAAIGQSAYGQKYQLVERLLKHEDNIMGKFNDNLQDLKHKAAILNEARAGKPVSEEVLKDYPDVAAYTLPRGSDGYKDAVHRLAIKYLPTHGMDTPSVINSFREDAKNTKDALEKNVANDIADDMEKYYQSQQKKSSETMAKLGDGTGPTMGEMIAENKRVKAQLAALESGEEAPVDSKKEIADLRKEQKSLMMQIVKAGMEETPVQEARMAEIEKRIAELEGKPVKAEKPKDTRSVEEIEKEIEDLKDKLANEFNKDKRMALIKEIGQQETDLGAAEYRAAQEAEEEPLKQTVTLYHGTSSRYDKLDPSKSGGMVFFGEDQSVGERYAQNGGGGRARLDDTQKYIIENGVVYELTGFKRVPKTFTSLGVDLKYEEIEGGAWKAIGLTPEEGLINKGTIKPLDKKYPDLSLEEAQELTDPDSGSAGVVPKDSRIIEKNFTGLNLLDISTPEGRDVIAGLKPKTQIGQGLVEAAQFDARDKTDRNSTTQLNSNFWGVTKYASVNGKQIQEDVVGPLKAMGYDGIRFQDDQHKSIGLFDTGLEKEKAVSNREADQAAEKQPQSTGSKSLDAMRGVKFTPDEDDKKAIAVYKQIKENNPEADVDDEIANPNGHLPIEEKENAKGIKIGDLIYEKGDPNPSIAITVSENSVTTVNQKTGAQDGSKDIDSISKEPIPYDFSFDFGYGEINVNVNRWMNRKSEWSVEMQGPGASETGYLSALALAFKGERGTPAFENWVEQVVRAQTKEMAEAEKPKKAQKKKVTTPKTKEAPLSLEYTKALDDSREATKEFSKAQEAYRAQEIDDDEFLIARKKYDLATAQFDQAFKQEQNRPAKEVADEVLPAEEPEAAGLLENEPYTFEGQFTEIGDEEQRTLITDQSSKLSEAQINTLEQEYGAKNGSDEFFEALRKDVIAYVTQGAKAVSGKIRAIIRQMANGLLSVAIVFNPQFVSQPYTIAVPQYDIRTSEVVKELPKEAQSMSDAAKRAYGVIYPTLEAQLKADNKLFIVADKQSGNTYMFQPDGSLLLQSKTLFGAGIGDFMKGDNNIVANRITPAGLFDLGMRDAKRSASEEYMYGDYDFGKVFVLDKSYMGRNGPYSQLVMHSVWTNETDAKRRLAALDKPGAEDSRYSFGCINVNKETFRNLITNHLDQMDGAKIFIVPENGSNVMDFVNGKATYSEDIIRQRVTPVTKTTKIGKQQAAPKTEERTMVAKEEEGTNLFNLESPNSVQVNGRSIPVTKHKLEKNNQIVKVNVNAFDDAFSKTQWQYIGEEGKGGIGDRYKNFGKFIANAKSIEAPNVAVNKDGSIVFGDGRHRYAYLRDAGVTNIPLSMDAESIKNAKKFGYISEQVNMNLGDSLVKLVDQMADELAEDQKKRSPSLIRKLKTLNRQRKEGRLTDEEYAQMSNEAIEEDYENAFLTPAAPRKRGYLLIQEKMSAAVRRGELSREAYDLANWFMLQNEALVYNLGISIKGKGPLGVGGFYNNLSRIITLIKEGSSDLTATHEILHHLERMMPPKIQQAIRKAWLSQLTKAQKTAKSPAAKLYFAALMDAHFGANDPTLLNIPEGAGNEYAAARSNMEDSGKKTSMELAKQLLVLEFVPIEAYQYFDPSEFWAVNGTDIVKARYDAVKGGMLAKLKNWLRELGQKIKSIFGLNSDASIIRALDSLAKSDGSFVTDDLLVQGEFLNISKNFRGGEMPKATWAMKESNNFDDWVYTWQDNYRDLKNVQKIITDQIGKIDDRLNAYRKETLNPGRETEQAQEFLKYEVDPLVKEMRKDNVSNKELATYLHNRYAEERNEIINAKNKSPAVQDRGSGISTEKAREYLSNLPADRKQILENLANQIDKIVRGTQDILVTSGQETQETIDGWRSESPHYVPLNRDESELDFIVQTGGGNLGGYATAGKFGKEAMGSTKTVVNILENVMLQRDRAIRRAESIRIGQALYGMAIKYPNSDFWMAINPDAIKDMDALVAEMEGMGLDPELIENLLEQPKTAFVSKKTGAEGETIRDVKYRVNRSYQNARNVFPVRINGQNRFVLLNPKSPEALRLAAELKQLDSEKLGVFFGAASTFSRWFAAVNTQYNPAFGLVNIFNDTQGALVNLSSTPLAGQQAQVFKDVFPAIRGIARDIRKERKETTKTPIKTKYDADNLKPEDWTALWRLFRQTGGKTGFRDQMVRQRMNVQWKGFVPNFSFEDEHVMLRAMEKLEQGPIRQKVEWWADAFSDFNDTLENTVRLSTFKVAYLDNNLSAEEAAEIAKNITVNFNKRGARTKHVRGLYAFFNASLQGTARYAITLAGPAGKTIIKTGLAMGALNAMWMFLAGFDDDDPPQFTKNKGFVIPTFNGNYFIWNLPPGLRAIPNTGRLITEGMLISLDLMKSNRGMAGKISDASSVIVDAVNPFGGGTLMQTIAPTFLDPAVALAENKDSFGRPIFKEDQSLKPKPGWQRTRETASEFSKQLAYFINYISTGGEEFSKGFPSPTGDQLDYLIGQAAGGIGRELKRTGELIANKISGEETPAYRVPLANRFFGETKTDAATSARFYDNITMLAEHLNVLNGRIENKGDVQGYMNKNPVSKLAFASEDFEKDISSLNKDIADLQKLDETPGRKAQIKQLKETKIKIMTIFNDLVRQAQ